MPKYPPRRLGGNTVLAQKNFPRPWGTMWRGHRSAADAVVRCYFIDVGREQDYVISNSRMQSLGRMADYLVSPQY